MTNIVVKGPIALECFWWKQLRHSNTVLLNSSASLVYHSLFLSPGIQRNNWIEDTQDLFLCLNNQFVLHLLFKCRNIYNPVQRDWRYETTLEAGLNDSEPLTLSVNACSLVCIW